MVETHIGTVEEYIAAYSGLFNEATGYYCPYIPNTFLGAVRSRDDIKQSGLSFAFCPLFHQEIVCWLGSECMWKFKTEWVNKLKTEARITFEEAKGAIEFKLRFC